VIFVAFCANPSVPFSELISMWSTGRSGLTIRNRSPPASLQDAFNLGATPRPLRGEDPPKTHGEQTAIFFETLFWTPL